MSDKAPLNQNKLGLLPGIWRLRNGSCGVGASGESLPSLRNAALVIAAHALRSANPYAGNSMEEHVVYLIGSEPEKGQYPSEVLLDGDPPKIRVEGPLTDELKRAIALKHTHQYNLGYRIKGENVPKIWQWASKRKVPDYYTPQVFPCVSSRFKDVVERFEPDVHQFFPVTVVNKAKEKIAERWLWVVCNRIDGVDREHTTFVLKKGVQWMSSWREEGKRVRIPDAKLYHSKKQTEGYHFWRDKYLMGGGIYASDEAAEALLALELTAFAASKLETV